MARRKQRPFGESLEVERGGDEVLGRRMPRLPRVTDIEGLAYEAVESGIEKGEKFSARVQALVMAYGGAAGLLALWGLRYAAPTRLDALVVELDWLYLGILAISAMTAYGILQLLFDRAPPPSTGSGQFGSFVENHSEEGRWKRRLLAVAVGIVHTWVFLAG